MNRIPLRGLIALTTSSVLLAAPASASGQRGSIGVSAIVAPASAVVPSVATDLHELPGTVRDAIIRGRSGTGEWRGVRGKGDTGGSSWIIIVESAPIARTSPAPVTPDRATPDRRPALHVVTYTIAAAA